MNRFKVDENLSHEVASALRAQGVDALTVAEQHWVGHTDEQIIPRLRDEGRALITLDVGIGDLRRWSPSGHAGILVFRPPSDGRLAIASFVLQYIGRFLDMDLRNTVVIVSPKGIRTRAPEPDFLGDDFEDVTP